MNGMGMRGALLAGLLGSALWSPSATHAQGAPHGPEPATVLDDGPTERGEVIGAPQPEAATEAGSRPVFQLPFRWDQQWQAGAPHSTGDAALDFGPRRTGGTDDVVAAAAGTVQRVRCSGGSYPRVDHGDGWVSHYYHVVNVNWALVGRRVPAGTRLGDAGNAVPCGGRSTFPHVHFYVEHHGRPINAHGASMGGYTVHSTGRDYHGRWTDDGNGTTVVTNPGEAKCCLRSTTRPFAFPDQGELADLNGDGRDDWVLHRGTTLSISTDSGDPSGDPDAERRFTWGRNTDQVHLGDVTGDGRADLVFRRGAAYFVHDDLFGPGGDAGADRYVSWGSSAARLYLEDVDGDGRDDMVLRNGRSISISTDTFAPGGDAGPEHRFSFGLATDRLHLGDVTGDGRADFVLQRGAAYFIDHDVLLPGGAPGSDRQFTWGHSGDRLHLGDVDGDQREDFVRRRGGSLSVSTDSVVTGGDHDAEHRFAYGLGTDLVHLGDVSGDGTADIVLRRGRGYFVNDDAVLTGGDATADGSFSAGDRTDALVVQPTVAP